MSEWIKREGEPTLIGRALGYAAREGFITKEEMDKALGFMDRMDELHNQNNEFEAELEGLKDENESLRKYSHEASRDLVASILENKKLKESSEKAYKEGFDQGYIEA